jgi:hypothetical protein
MSVFEQWKALDLWKRQQVVLLLLKQHKDVTGQATVARGAGYPELAEVNQSEADACELAAEILQLASDLPMTDLEPTP